MADNKRYGRALRRPSDASVTGSTTQARQRTPQVSRDSSAARGDLRAQNSSRADISRSRAAATAYARPTRSVPTSDRRRAQNARQSSVRPARTAPNRYREKAYRPSAPTVYGRQTSLTSRSERKIQRLEKKELRRLEAEREWQSDIERVRGGVDKLMVVIILVLLALGALIIYSASYPAGITKKDNGYYFFTRHLIMLLIGFVAMFIISYIPCGFYKKGMGFVGYVITAACLIIAGFKGRNGEGVANVGRWIYIGSVGFQPSELMKLALIMVLAWYLDRYQNELKSSRTLDEKIDIIVEGKRGGFLRRLSRAFGVGSGSFWRTYRYNTIYPLAILGVSCLLVLFGKHLSGTVIVGCVGFAMILVAGCHPLYALSTTLAAGIPVVGIYLSLNKYALDRVLTYTSDNPDLLGDKWQLSQGILAIGSGGLFGVGYTGSRQKYGYLPEAYNDFVFSIWCEEFGFVGALLLIVLFIVFIWRGYLIAMRAPDKYSSMLAFGITTQVALQAIFNMCVACGIIPTTGISLPFISAGGSSLVILMAEMGILLSISRRYYRKTA